VRVSELHTKAALDSGAERPQSLPVNPDGIPAYLRERPQWVCWGYQQREGKWTKVPIDANSGRKAKSNDPATWADFGAALAAYRGRKLDGIGYVFAADGGEAGVDLDDARDAATGQLQPWAAEIIATLESYSEVSPSGTGVKVYVTGKKPDGPCRRKYQTGEVEVYGHGRFFAVTGCALNGTPAAVNERGEQLAAVCRRVFGDKPKKPGGQGGGVHRNGDGRPDDDEVIRRAGRAKNAAKFLRLWAGDTSGYNGDESRADAGLCAMLAFWCRRDAAQMDRLFRRSGLMRGKWDQVHFADGRTYGQATVEHAVAQCSETFEPRSRGKPRAKGHERNGDGRPPDEEGEPEDEEENPARMGYGLILDYFRESYAPAFRRNLAIYSETLGREVKMSEACCAPGIRLAIVLKGAADVPRVRGGGVDTNALPAFFRTWAPSAWKDMIEKLPDEEAAEVLVDLAEEEFRDRVAAALLTHVNLGKHYDGKDRSGEGTETQRRTLIDWCRIFAKGGKWADIRGYQVWCRREQGSNKLQVAVRKGLFGQLQGFADMAKLSATKLTQLMERYRIGQGGNENRVKGARAIVLTDDFLAHLEARPSDSLTDKADSGAPVCESGCQSGNNATSGDASGD
jgi:hypothetical protein